MGIMYAKPSTQLEAIGAGETARSWKSAGNILHHVNKRSDRSYKCSQVKNYMDFPLPIGLSSAPSKHNVGPDRCKIDIFFSQTSTRSTALVLRNTTEPSSQDNFT